MNRFIATLLLAAISTHSPAAKIRRLSVVSNYSTEIVFKYASPILIENEPLKAGAVGCFIAKLKSTGLFTDVVVGLKRTGDGKWIDIEITPTWDKRRKSFLISEIHFDGFEDFDLIMLRDALRKEGLEPGISLWKFPLWEIGNKVDEAASGIYASDDAKLDRIADVDMPHPRLYLEVLDSVNLRLTISLRREYPCESYIGQDHGQMIDCQHTE
jgi:hypothetical protein